MFEKFEEDVNRYSKYKEYNSKYRKTENGCKRRMYATLRFNSKKRGFDMPKFSYDEFNNWLGMWAFDFLYEQWVESGYENKLKPSVDRLDDSRGYYFGNMQLITWTENQSKDNVPVLQIKDGKVINEFNSIRGAEKETGIFNSNICACLSGRAKTAGGFTWKRNLIENYETR